MTIERMEEIADVNIQNDALVITPSTINIDPRPEVARTVIEQGWDLLEMRALAADLESIFLEVTRQQRGTEVAQPGTTDVQDSTSAELTEAAEAEEVEHKEEA